MQLQYNLQKFSILRSFAKNKKIKREADVKWNPETVWQKKRGKETDEETDTEDYKERDKELNTASTKQADIDKVRNGVRVILSRIPAGLGH